MSFNVFYITLCGSGALPFFLLKQPFHHLLWSPGSGQLGHLRKLRCLIKSRWPGQKVSKKQNEERSGYADEPPLPVSPVPPSQLGHVSPVHVLMWRSQWTFLIFMQWAPCFVLPNLYKHLLPISHVIKLWCFLFMFCIYYIEQQ